jgi:hypothetical protein
MAQGGTEDAEACGTGYHREATEDAEGCGSGHHKEATEDAEGCGLGHHKEARRTRRTAVPDVTGKPGGRRRPGTTWYRNFAWPCSNACATRHRATHRSRVRGFRSKVAATVAYEPSPRSYASMARRRKSTSYAFGMTSLKYSFTGHSRGNREPGLAHVISGSRREASRTKGDVLLRCHRTEPR